MRFIPTRVHGALDYLVGVLLIAAPWLFNFSGTEAATWTTVLIGAGTIVYSTLTNYEFGVAPVISMPTHLGIDGMAGIILIVSPWLFGFSNAVWEPHLVIGVFELLAALTTHRVPVAATARYQT